MQDTWHLTHTRGSLDLPKGSQSTSWESLLEVTGSFHFLRPKTLNWPLILSFPSAAPSAFPQVLLPLCCIHVYPLFICILCPCCLSSHQLDFWVSVVFYHSCLPLLWWPSLSASDGCSKNPSQHLDETPYFLSTQFRDVFSPRRKAVCSALSGTPHYASVLSPFLAHAESLPRFLPFLLFSHQKALSC